MIHAPDADLIVVGGRVAGCLTAARAAARGLDVLMLESQRFPSDTMSTHFFRGDGLVRSLDEIGVLDEVLATGAPPLRTEINYANGAACGEICPPQEPGDAGFCLSVRRWTLDTILARHVSVLANVDLRTQAPVADLLLEDGRVTGVVTRDGSTFRAPLVVGADGRRSTVARRVHAVVQREIPPARVMYFQYVTGWTSPSGAPPDAPEFSLLGDELVYVFPSDHGVTCVALSLNVSEWQTSRLARAEKFTAKLTQHAGLWSRLDRCSPVAEVVAAPPTDSRILAAAGPGWVLVGDAGTHQDPWTGFGMDTAARQAEALVASLDASDPMADYQQRRDAVTLKRFDETAVGAPDLRSLLSSNQPPDLA